MNKATRQTFQLQSELAKVQKDLAKLDPYFVEACMEESPYLQVQVYRMWELKRELGLVK
jgi:hypothetical protein